MTKIKSDFKDVSKLIHTVTHAPGNFWEGRTDGYDVIKSGCLMRIANAMEKQNEQSKSLVTPVDVQKIIDAMNRNTMTLMIRYDKRLASMNVKINTLKAKVKELQARPTLEI